MFSECPSLEDRSEDIDQILNKGFEFENFNDLMKLTVTQDIPFILGVTSNHASQVRNFNSKLKQIKQRLNPTLVTYI